MIRGNYQQIKTEFGTIKDGKSSEIQAIKKTLKAEYKKEVVKFTEELQKFKREVRNSDPLTKTASIFEEAHFLNLFFSSDRKRSRVP